jgi:hypothetical protein
VAVLKSEERETPLAAAHVFGSWPYLKRVSDMVRNKEVDQLEGEGSISMGDGIRRTSGQQYGLTRQKDPDGQAQELEQQVWPMVGL